MAVHYKAFYAVAIKSAKMFGWLHNPQTPMQHSSGCSQNIYNVMAKRFNTGF